MSYDWRSRWYLNWLREPCSTFLMFIICVRCPCNFVLSFTIISTFSSSSKRCIVVALQLVIRIQKWSHATCNMAKHISDNVKATTRCWWFGDGPDPTGIRNTKRITPVSYTQQSVKKSKSSPVQNICQLFCSRVLTDTYTNRPYDIIASLSATIRTSVTTTGRSRRLGDWLFHTHREI